MNTPLKRLLIASLVNLAGNALGTVISVQGNLAAKLGSVPNAPTVFQDFVALKGTALSAPLSFLLIQIVLTSLVPRPGWLGRIGIGGLTFVGLLYTVAQAGEPIVWRQFTPGGFNALQALMLLVNIASAVAMLVFGVQAWRSRPATPAVQLQE